MRRLLWAACFFALLAGGASLAAEVKVPSAPVMWATDRVNFLSEPVRRDLDTKLYLHEQKTGMQILVYIAKTTGDTPLEDWSVKAFEAWGVGKKGKDDGLVLFVMADDKKMRIEVGYGLEDRVPDAIASRIINEVITPRLKTGDNDGAMTAGVDAVLAAADGKPFGVPAAEGTSATSGGVPPPHGPVQRQPVPFWQIAVFAILGIGFLILLITHPSFALWLLFQIFSAALSGGGGGGSGGGGGWSGGGGRSGGGGASGSW